MVLALNFYLLMIIRLQALKVDLQETSQNGGVMEEALRKMGAIFHRAANEIHNAVMTTSEFIQGRRRRLNEMVCSETIRWRHISTKRLSLQT